MPRREAIKGLAGAGVSAVAGLAGARRAAAADAAVSADIVRFGADIEPLVRLIEDTPRERVIEVIAQRVRSGLAYRPLLASLFLAGIRNVNPQPPGFKLHCVFVLHSAHQLGLDAPESERLLPLFWALDYFKQAQAQDVEQGDFRLRPVQGPLPSAHLAWNEFREAMEQWDAPRADRAIAALARSRGAHEVMEGLWRYGARDYRNIGHKAIYTANAWRTLQAIGWQHAEPALRSLVLGLLDFGVERRMNGFRFEDQCHAANSALASAALSELPPEWADQAPVSRAATIDALAAVRDGSAAEASAATAKMLSGGSASAGAIWDAVHLASGELMLRLPGILGVHCVTSANALHYAFRVGASAETRLYILLQAVGWMAQFAHFMSGEDGFRDRDIAKLAQSAEEGGTPRPADVLDLVSSDPDAASASAFDYGLAHPDGSGLLSAARHCAFRKTDDAHDLKFAAAIEEDIALTSPSWRPHMLAAGAYYFRGNGHPDSAVVDRARDALGLV